MLRGCSESGMVTVRCTGSRDVVDTVEAVVVWSWRWVDIGVEYVQQVGAMPTVVEAHVLPPGATGTVVEAYDQQPGATGTAGEEDVQRSGAMGTVTEEYETVRCQVRQPFDNKISI